MSTGVDVIILCVYNKLKYRLLMRMMEVKRECVSTRDQNGETSLHYAVEAGVFETAEAIINEVLDDFDLTE